MTTTESDGAKESLVDRIWAVLSDEPTTRVVRMFGGQSFMVRDQMVVAARERDALLVRVDPERSDELLAKPGVRIAEMGSGRSMGSGWLEVDPDELGGEQLGFWIRQGLEFNATRKPTRRKAARKK